MRQFILGTLFSIAVAINPASAALLDFSFSFTNDIQGVEGQVTGRILGLTDNATAPAAQVIIDTVPAAFPSSVFFQSLPVDTLAATSILSHNSFTVQSGVIVATSAYDSLALITSQFWQLGLSSVAGSLSFVDNEATIIQGTIDYTQIPAAVPLPAALPLLGSGLAVMSLIGWRRRRKATAA